MSYYVWQADLPSGRAFLVGTVQAAEVRQNALGCRMLRLTPALSYEQAIEVRGLAARAYDLGCALHPLGEPRCPQCDTAPAALCSDCLENPAP